MKTGERRTHQCMKTCPKSAGRTGNSSSRMTPDVTKRARAKGCFLSCLAMAIAVAGCDGGGEGSSTAATNANDTMAETDSNSTSVPAPDSATTSGEESDSTGARESAGTDDDTSGGADSPSTCYGQADPAACAAARESKTGRSCGWAVPIHYAPRTCEVEPFDAATCLPVLEPEECAPLSPTCADGSARYFRTLGHSLEVIAPGSSCFDLSDFDPCPVAVDERGTDTDTDGGDSSGGWLIDELIAAVCACSCSSTVAFPE